MITCTFEDNGSAKLRHVTCNAIVIKDNQILLAKRGTYNNGKPLSEAGKWALLGGYLNRDENIVTALKREVMEESGWEIDNLQLVRINDNPNRPKEDRQNVDMIFVAKGVQQIGKNDEEVRELKWFKLDELPPPETIAFDHAEDIEVYLQSLKGEVQLPQLG